MYEVVLLGKGTGASHSEHVFLPVTPSAGRTSAEFAETPKLLTDCLHVRFRSEEPRLSL
jgi:hypothetical protein